MKHSDRSEGAEVSASARAVAARRAAVFLDGSKIKVFTGDQIFDGSLQGHVHQTVDLHRVGQLAASNEIDPFDGCCPDHLNPEISRVASAIGLWDQRSHAIFVQRNS